jgi:5-methylthioadenosine/S-adenosylhomocysteine deaminase
LAHRERALLHCPRTNLKLGSGMAQCAGFSIAECNVSIGCDGAPANNHAGCVADMREAALFPPHRPDRESSPPKTFFTMATERAEG